MAEETHEVEPGGWHDAVLVAREEGFAFLDWLSAVDRTYDEAAAGFDVVCHLYDVGRTGALRGALLRTRVADGTPLASVTDVFAGAAWHERETFEMFGIEFDGYDDGTGLGLRPLLLPYMVGSLIGSTLIAAVAYPLALAFVRKRRRHLLHKAVRRDRP